MPLPFRHVAMLASPLPGHLNPLQVLGAELVRAGHRVTVVHIDGTDRFVTDPAIDFAPIPAATDALDGYLATLARPDGVVGLNRMIRATAAMTARLLDGAPDVLARIGADAVIADAAEPAGPLVAARLRIPHVAAITGLPLLREPGVPPPFVGWPYRDGWWGRFRNRGGHAVSDLLLHPIVRMLEARRRAWRILPDAPRLSVSQCPRGLDFPRTALPAGFHYGSPWRAGEGEDATLPDDGRPLVFCSLGTLQGSRVALFATIAAACAASGARAVIGHGGGLLAAEAAALPGDPLVRAFWPQRAVLRRCAAAILHGGFNTVLDALAAGLPMVVLPIGFEQPATAARLARIGAARVLTPAGLSADRLAAALREVLAQPGYRAASARIAAEIAADSGVAGAAAAVSAALAAP